MFGTGRGQKTFINQFPIPVLTEALFHALPASKTRKRALRRRVP